MKWQGGIVGVCLTFKKWLSYFPKRLYVVPSHQESVGVPVTPQGVWFDGQEGRLEPLPFPSNHYADLMGPKL